MIKDGAAQNGYSPQLRKISVTYPSISYEDYLEQYKRHHGSAQGALSLSDFTTKMHYRISVVVGNVEFARVRFSNFQTAL